MISNLVKITIVVAGDITQLEHLMNHFRIGPVHRLYANRIGFPNLYPNDTHKDDREGHSLADISDIAEYLQEVTKKIDYK